MAKGSIHTLVDTREEFLPFAPETYLEDRERALLALFGQEGRIGTTGGVANLQCMHDPLGIACICCMVVVRVKHSQFVSHLVNLAIRETFAKRLTHLDIDGRDIVNTIAYGIEIHHAAPREQKGLMAACKLLNER